MARIALLTPAAHNPYVRIWGPAFDRLTAALSGAGLDVVPMEWPKAAEADVTPCCRCWPGAITRTPPTGWPCWMRWRRVA